MGSPGSPTSPTPRRHRLALALLAAALAVVTAIQFVGQRSVERALLAETDQLGLASRHPKLTRQLRREPPAHARLALARALLADELSGSVAGVAPEGHIERLRRARELATSAGRDLPTSWEAPMITGATLYLERLKTRDDQLFLAAGDWETPLLRSHRLAPTEAEPVQFLAAAYLEIWPTLSIDKKRTARQLLTRAMTDPAHFRRLIGPWLDRAGRRAAALEVIPDDAQAWREVVEYYARKRDWKSYLATRQRLQASHHRELLASLEEAEVRRQGGNLRGARHQFLTVAAELPPGPSSDPLVNRAIARSPAGAANPHYSAGLRRQLHRALDLALLRQSPLDGSVVARIAVAVGELEPATMAAAALVADDLPRAEQIERQASSATLNPAWVPYYILYARTLLERGEVESARRALEQVGVQRRDRLAYWLVRTEVERRIGEEAPQATQRLTAFSELERPATAWRPRGTSFQLPWLAPAEATGFEVVLSSVPDTGAPLEVRVDGAPVATAAARRIGDRLRIAVPMAAGEPHLIEIEPLAGATVIPGAIRFRLASG